MLGFKRFSSKSIPGAAALSSRIGGCPTHGLSLPKRLTHHRVEIGSSRRSGSLGAEGAEARTRLGKGRTCYAHVVAGRRGT